MQHHRKPRTLHGDFQEGPGQGCTVERNGPLWESAARVGAFTGKTSHILEMPVLANFKEYTGFSGELQSLWVSQRSRDGPHTAGRLAGTSSTRFLPEASSNLCTRIPADTLAWKHPSLSLTWCCTILQALLALKALLLGRGGPVCRSCLVRLQLPVLPRTALFPI